MNSIFPISATLSKASIRACFAICLCAATLQTAAYFPGYLSHDSAYQWWQARTGQISTIWPPGALWLLRALDQAGSGPPIVFVLNMFTYWLAIALIAINMASLRGAIATLFLLGALPISLICFPHVWIDVLMAAVLILATALFFVFTTSTQRQLRWLVLPILLLLFASIIRHNALSATVPFCFFTAYLALLVRGEHSWPGVRWVTFLYGSVLFAAMIGFYASAVKIATAKRAETWSVTLMWDLQALSIKTGRVLIPDNMHGPGLTVEELKDAFRPVDGAILYAKIKTPLANPLEPYTPAQRETLIRAWRDAVLAHPSEYLAHRTYVAQKILGAKRVHEEDGTADQPGFVAFSDNPPTIIANPRLNAYAQSLATGLKSTTLLAPVWWLLSGSLIAVVLAWRRRHALTLTDGLALTLVASAWMYLAPLLWHLLPIFVMPYGQSLRVSLRRLLACLLHDQAHD
jgi:hypothetical protein